MDTRLWMDASTIPGNASQSLKQSLVDLISVEAKLNKARGTRGFEPQIASRIEWTDISILPKPDEPLKLEGRVVGEITVQEGAPCFPRSFRSRPRLAYPHGTRVLPRQICSTDAERYMALALHCSSTSVS